MENDNAVVKGFVEHALPGTYQDSVTGEVGVLRAMVAGVGTAPFFAIKNEKGFFTIRHWADAQRIA